MTYYYFSRAQEMESKQLYMYTRLHVQKQVKFILGNV
jgi:hypothetical protein